MKRTLLLLTLLAAGCQTTVVGRTPPSEMHTSIQAGSPLQEQNLGGSLSSDEAVMTDPSAAKLHEIAGAILEFRAIKGEMPKELTDLKSTSDENIDLICPLTRTPYVYVPDGLHSPGKSKGIVAYEPVARPNGTRWCILMADARPGGAQALEVIQLTDAVFLGYR